MTEPYLLDTNCYFLLLERPKLLACQKLEEKLINNEVMSFYISEISSMEIHSVLGKYRRGSPRQIQICERDVIDEGIKRRCAQKWVSSERKKLPRRLFHDLQKLISDMESQRGHTQATILDLDNDSILRGKQLLIKYSDQYRFGSHDALIAGTLVSSREMKGLDLTLVTSDRSLQAVIKEESLPFFDPQIEKVSP